MSDVPDCPDAVVVGILEEILGARSRVSVLRELCRASPNVIWPSRIVQWTGLPRSTVWDALRRLEETGIAVPTPIELRRSFPWRIPYRHPLEASLCALFVAERKAARWARMSEEEREDERKFQAVLAKTRASLEARGIPFDADFWDP